MSNADNARAIRRGVNQARNAARLLRAAFAGSSQAAKARARSREALRLAIHDAIKGTRAG